MAALDNKHIPLVGWSLFEVEIDMPKVNEDGQTEMQKKHFYHFYDVDSTGHVYMIPAFNVNGKWCRAYSAEDIINASLGDEKSKNKIEFFRRGLENYFGMDVMSERNSQRIYDQERGRIPEDVNNNRAKKDLPPIDVRVPKSPKTPTNLLPSELAQIVGSTQEGETSRYTLPDEIAINIFEDESNLLPVFEKKLEVDETRHDPVMLLPSSTSTEEKSDVKLPAPIVQE